MTPLTSPTPAADRRTAHLASWFLESARRWPDRPALSFADRSFTYSEVEATARQWAVALVEAAGGPPARVGLFAHRSEVSYVGVLAVLLAGAAFVPLNRTFPTSRTRAMVNRADLDVLLVDDASLAQLDEVAPASIPVVAPRSERPGRDGRALGRAEIRRLGLGLGLAPAPGGPAETSDQGDLAYLLFTSGSTGVPKGVPISHGAVSQFLVHNLSRYGFGPDDRLSQTFDQTFDLSVFDLFMAWGSGACVCAMRPLELLSPFNYVRDRGITVWFSVPSVAVLLMRKRLLTPGSLETLRWSLFCGEALPRRVAETWQRAAPRSVIENLYGPTELTIACAAYRWDPDRSPAECVDDIVPLGQVYPHLQSLVVDRSRRPVAPGSSGELVVAGPQAFAGYWRDPATTATKVFDAPAPDGQVRRFYATGDRVRRDRAGGLVYLGRVDHQVQIRGYRVELQEIEAVLRRTPGVDEAAVVPWPHEAGTAQGLVAFVTGSVEADAVARQARDALPAYMVPSTVHVLDRLPLNTSGKIDRGALASDLDGGITA